MIKANVRNEKVKRRYFRWLKEAAGFSSSTIDSIEGAICKYEEFSGYADLGAFSESRAVGFKRWLDKRPDRTRAISTTTKYHLLRHLQSFFKWLATQPGFKSKIDLDAISYLSLDKKSVREALSPRPRKFPSLSDVERLAESIAGEGEIERRDRAIISLLLLSGMRYTAVCTLSLGCFDEGQLTISQDPKLGVKTKNGKAIFTRLFPFSRKLLRHVLDWVTYLREIRGWSPTDPLFPRTHIRQAEGGLSFVVDGVEPVFWSGGNSIRDIIKSRSQTAGLPYYNPHAFRYAAVHLASQFCTTPEQFKAVSQNLGHEHVATTLKTYGMLDTPRAHEVISKIDFERKPGDGAVNIPLEELERLLGKYRKKDLTD